jgi:hypothetical protein
MLHPHIKSPLLQIRLPLECILQVVLVEAPSKVRTQQNRISKTITVEIFHKCLQRNFLTPVYLWEFSKKLDLQWICFATFAQKQFASSHSYQLQLKIKRAYLHFVCFIGIIFALNVCCQHRRVPEHVCQFTLHCDFIVTIWRFILLIFVHVVCHCVFV